MDDIVKAAMQKWPNVPHCYGWLGLDMRGQWYMRDDATQALGGFNDSVKTRGSLLKHEKLVDFIQRNYQCDATGPAKGQWYFQRYIKHFPSKGEIVLFDRSWYNRAGVEKVMGFCNEEEYLEFMREVPELERNLIRSGIYLFKF